MGQYKKFSEGFKEAFITKVMNRGDQSISGICRQEGVGASAAYRWISDRGNPSVMKKSKNSLSWTGEEKLKALLESHGLGEEALGLFLRKEGLHSHQIDGWKTEIVKALGPQSNCGKDNRDHKIRELEKDLNRKDKALAEASALLILQKKVNLIWGDKSEDEK